MNDNAVHLAPPLMSLLARLPRAPLRWRLALFSALLLTLVLATLGVFLYQQMDAYLLSSTLSRLRADAEPSELDLLPATFSTAPIASTRAVPISGEEPPRTIVSGDQMITVRLVTLEQAAPGIVARLTAADTTPIVLDQEGEVVARPHADSVAPEAPEPDGARARRVARRGVADSYEATAPDGTHMLVSLTPLRRGPDGPIIGVLALSTPLTDADSILSRLRWLLAGSLAVALLVCVAVGVPITRAALRPLDRLVFTAERIAGSDLSARSQLPHGNDEVGRLAGSFDRMLGRIEQGFQAQRRFVADAAHELRTPLTAVAGMTELLLLGADNEDRATRRRMLVTVDADLERLTRLVNDLLTLSRHDLATPRTREPFDLAGLVLGVAEQTETLAADRVVSVSRPPGPLTVVGDADDLRRVVLNLADNARRYTPPGGAIRFRLVRSGAWVELRVSDTGPGIAAGDLPRIFDRFYRGDRARARDSGGAGLGLAIAKAIAEAHGGALEAASTPGQGATFTLRLPAAPAS